MGYENCAVLICRSDALLSVRTLHLMAVVRMNYYCSIAKFNFVLNWLVAADT